MSNIEKMNGLVNYLTDNGFKYENDVDMSTVYFSKIYREKEWLFSLTEPHNGNDNKWLWRAEKRENFDRWGNSYFESKYKGNGHFISYAVKDFEQEADKYNDEE